MKEYTTPPLMYPGSKSRAINQIAPLIPTDITDYREPFIGGGSVFLFLKSINNNPNTSYWINDLQPELYNFWVQIQNNPQEIIAQIKQWKIDFRDNQIGLTELFQRDNIFKTFTPIQAAAKYYTLNRTVFGGKALLTNMKMQSPLFNDFIKSQSEENIQIVSYTMNGNSKTKITNLNYSYLLSNVSNPNSTFLFLDPPYYSAKNLYGKGRFNNHQLFNHHTFAQQVKETKCKWLITYDDTPVIRSLFKDFTIIPFEFKYSMVNQRTGHEIFIMNYQPPVKPINNNNNNTKTAQSKKQFTIMDF